MKTQILTFGLLLVALSFTSCKKSETPAPETTAPETTVTTTAVDTTIQQPVTAVTDSVKPAEKVENEANEKN